MFESQAQLVLETATQVAKTPQRLLRACVERAVALCVDLDTSGNVVHDRLEAMTDQMMNAISDARSAIEITACAKKAEAVDPERKSYLAGLLKGDSVSLNGRFKSDSKEDMAVAGSFQEFLADMDSVTIEEFDETITRYVCVMPVDHPSLDLQFAVTRSELALSDTTPSAADLNGIYYGITFGTVEK